MRIKNAATIGLLMGGILIFALFCAGCATETVPDAEAELCSDLVELNASLARLESLNTSSTMDEFRSAADQVRDDMQQVRSNAADVQEARADELVAAQENLDRAIQDVPGDATLEQALATVRDELAVVRVERDQYFADLGCS